MDLINTVIVTAPQLGSCSALVYDVLTGTVLHSYKGVQAASSTLTVTGPDQHVLCACKERPLLQCWQLNKHSSVDVRLTLPGRAASVAVSPSSPTTLVAAIGEVLHVYNLESGCRIALISRHFQPVSCLAFYPCGNYFVSGGEDGFVYVWSLATITATRGVAGRTTVQPYRQLGQHSDKVTSLSIVGGTRGRLLSTSSDHTARVYDLYTLSLLHTVVCDSPVTAGALALVSTRVVLGTLTGHVLMINVEPYTSSETIRVPESECSPCHTGPVNAVCPLLSGRTLITAGEDGEVKVWAVETATGSEDVATLEGATSRSSKRLTLQRTIHRGKGPVTNLIGLLIDRKCLTEDAPPLLSPPLPSLHPGPYSQAAITVYPPPRPTVELDDNTQYLDHISAPHSNKYRQLFQFLLDS